MSRVRNADWQDDEGLKEDLQRYVLQNLKRAEILDFMIRDYPQYAWSLGTISRRLSFFEIKYINYDTNLEVIENVVREECEGPGQLLGYRAMHLKLREQYQLAVPRNLVHDVMTYVDPEALQNRGNVGKKKRHRGATGTFTSLGPNHTHSGDGHDKLMDFKNSTFPLAVYGLQDVFSGKILYLKVWTSNSDPKLVGRWYLEHLYNTRVISKQLRLDKGSETGDMATIHAFLRNRHPDVSSDDDAADTVHYGPSTNNKIERWWRELHHRLEKFFKRQLRMLIDQGHYDPDDQKHRDLLAYIYIPLLQKEINTFQQVIWNSHRIRSQRDAQLPKGVPNHVYAFPQSYGAEECGLPVSQEELDEVSEMSGVMAIGKDYLSSEVRGECERIIPDLGCIEPPEMADAYLFLKTHFRDPSS